MSSLRSRVRELRPVELSAARQSFVALALNSTTSLAAGALLGALAPTFAAHPGLLVMVPAAIGLRGNIFSAVGNRVSTSIHAGTFRFTARRDSILGHNVGAAVVLTFGLSLVLAVLAKAIAVALDVDGSVPLTDLIVVSVVGGALASTLILAVTLGLAAGAVRFGWDLDDVNAPLVSTVGDVLTLPALWLAIHLLGIQVVTPAVGVVLAVVGAAALVAGLRSGIRGLRRIVQESLPILTVAAAISALAGIAVEKRFDSFDAYPALLVLLPAFLSSAGALGGVLSSRLSSKLHLGLVAPGAVPSREARRDIGFVATLAVPVYALNALGAHVLAGWLGHASPGIPDMLLVALGGGAAAVAFVLAVAYAGTVAAFRTGVDPDTYGIPVVTSTVDLAGAFALVLAVAALGIG